MQSPKFAAITLFALTLACGGEPLDKVFSEHEAQLDECLGYRLDAEAKAEQADKILRNPLAGPGQKQDAQVTRSIARTVGMTHDACVARLLEAAAVTAADKGVSPEELSEAWRGWYDARAAAQRE